MRIQQHYLPMEYGQVTLAQCQAHATRYVGQQTRQAQNSYAMYHCIMASLTESARAKVMLKEDEYTLNNVRSGVCLLKVVIRQSDLDSNATSKHLREQLSNLDDYMAKLILTLKNSMIVLKT